MRSSGVNGEGELRGQLANPGSPGKMASKTVCVGGGIPQHSFPFLVESWSTWYHLHGICAVSAGYMSSSFPRSSLM